MMAGEGTGEGGDGLPVVSDALLASDGVDVSLMRVFAVDPEASGSALREVVSAQAPALLLEDDVACLRMASLRRALESSLASRFGVPLDALRSLAASEAAGEGEWGASKTGPGPLCALFNVTRHASAVQARLLAAFDAAREGGNVEKMRAAAGPLARLGQHEALVRRYVSSLPLFIDAAQVVADAAMAPASVPTMHGEDDVSGGESAGAGGSGAREDGGQAGNLAQGVERSLGRLFRDLLAQTRREAAQAYRVFPVDPDSVAVMIARRVLEQRALTALEAILERAEALGTEEASLACFSVAHKSVAELGGLLEGSLAPGLRRGAGIQRLAEGLLGAPRIAAYLEREQSYLRETLRGLREGLPPPGEAGPHLPAFVDACLALSRDGLGRVRAVVGKQRFRLVRANACLLDLLVEGLGPAVLAPLDALVLESAAPPSSVKSPPLTFPVLAERVRTAFSLARTVNDSLGALQAHMHRFLAVSDALGSANSHHAVTIDEDGGDGEDEGEGANGGDPLDLDAVLVGDVGESTALGSLASQAGDTVSDLENLQARNNQLLSRAAGLLERIFDRLIASSTRAMVHALRSPHPYAEKDARGKVLGVLFDPVLPPTPSAACLKLCAEVRHLLKAVRLPSSIGGQNAERFLGELAIAMVSAVNQAATDKGTLGVGAQGAIRLKVDLAELSTFCANEVSGAAAPAWEELSRLSNVFIVPPDELPTFSADTFGPQLAEPMADRVDKFIRARADMRAGTVPLTLTKAAT